MKSQIESGDGTKVDTGAVVGILGALRGEQKALVDGILDDLRGNLQSLRAMHEKEMLKSPAPGRLALLREEQKLGNIIEELFQGSDRQLVDSMLEGGKPYEVPGELIATWSCSNVTCS